VIKWLYRKFIYNYSHIVDPMTTFLRKNIKFVWNKEFQTAFDDLKETLTTTLILKTPNFWKPFLLTTDASEREFSIIFSHDGRPIAYESRKAKDLECNYPTHNLELLVVIHTYKFWRNYLLGLKFKIMCSHRGHKYVMT